MGQGIASTEYISGQRWASTAEPHMGLGTVLSSKHRTLTIAFPASGETRSYAKQSAPLTRVIFNVGDTICTEDNISMIIDSVSYKNGLITYQGTNDSKVRCDITEDRLASNMQLSRPMDRLFNGQIDSAGWFQARIQTLNHRNRLLNNDLHGLLGCRTNLIPHQLYLVNEIACRYAPRVLLADEVGLGKTIEAGMIIHHQIITERAQRILIVVPENLVYQWLVEMLRKFNLMFSVFDADRYHILKQSDPETNPFQTDQLILCSIEFLVENEEHHQQSLLGEWDILIVDEVHRLYWSSNKASTEYKIIEQLANSTKGVLLLTATPQQLGKESHYARLRLLDPNRFTDFDSFMQAEQNYQPIAQAVEALLSDKSLTNTMVAMLEKILSDSGTIALKKLALTESNATENMQAKKQIIEELLDYHGTGRVFFRNTRATIKDFPHRMLNPYPLACATEYLAMYTECRTGLLKTNTATSLLYPEIIYQQANKLDWHKIDPRIAWLIDKIKSLQKEKVLIICAHAGTAIDIGKLLTIKHGLHVAIFHEHLSLLERDRAAAYFANEYQGSQALICSEIGSEGRNFQFAHHLILFDLPPTPDLLEQRIGRLDRIGQQHSINIHVPYLENTPQAILFNWYQKGLNAFTHTCPDGQIVFEQLATDLKAAFQAGGMPEALINKTNKIHQQLKHMMEQGRDRLLEYSSYRTAIAVALRDQAVQQDKQDTLPQYMDLIFDCFGINAEFHSQSSYILRPSESMLLPFPGLSDEGMPITYSRETALTHEDRQYLTWEHPLVLYAMDIILSSERGNVTACTLKQTNIAPGTLLIETYFILEPADKIGMHSSRYLPPSIIRIILDEHRQVIDIAQHLIDENQTNIAPEIIKQIIELKADTIKNLLQRATILADKALPNLQQQAQKRITSILQTEIDRLIHMKKLNASVRDEEIQYFTEQLNTNSALITSALPRLDTLRLIITV